MEREKKSNLCAWKNDVRGYKTIAKQFRIKFPFLKHRKENFEYKKYQFLWARSFLYISFFM